MLDCLEQNEMEVLYLAKSCLSVGFDGANQAVAFRASTNVWGSRERESHGIKEKGKGGIA